MKLAGQAVDLLAKMKQNKLSAEEQARRIAREDELTRADAALKADLARKEAERLDKAQAQAHELAMLQARGQMSAEALMSLSGPDQARTIADLKKTEAMKGMSDEQVYAMMAAQSPAVAQALAERFKAAAARPAGGGRPNPRPLRADAGRHPAGQGERRTSCAPAPRIASSRCSPRRSTASAPAWWTSPAPPAARRPRPPARWSS